MKKILLIGSGGREHAIAKAISKNKEAELICFASHENPGIKALAKEIIIIDLLDIEAVINVAKTFSFNFAIIGPEGPLELGLSDALHAVNIPVIGPTKKLARIETSKIFCRQLIESFDHSILPKFKVFNSTTLLEDYMHELGNSFVIKVSQLMGGKGVYVFGDHFHTNAQAIEICQSILKQGREFIIEEKLIGEEFSLLSFCDGKTLSHMPIIQDNKRLSVDDEGPNTGGMGSVSFANHSLPFLNDTELAHAKLINQKSIEYLQKACTETYKGIIYGGYMLTKSGIKLIEFNARFGDPESINLLPLLETDFVTICESIVTGTLSELAIEFSNKATVCKYIVPSGYPNQPTDKQNIYFEPEEEKIFCAHVKQDSDSYIMLGSRALAVLGIDKEIESAEQQAEILAQSIRGDIYYRQDIGTKTLLFNRFEKVRNIREQAY